MSADSVTRETQTADARLDHADVRHLLDGLDDSREPVAIAALRALARLPLRRDVAREVATVIDSRLDWIAGDGTWPPQYEPEKWHRAVIEAAIRMPDDVDRRKLYTILRRGDEQLRHLTARSLARAGDAAALPYIVGHLSEGDPELRCRAAWSLTWLNVSPVRYHLRQLCASDPDPRVRLWLGLALARIGDSVGLESLLEAVDAGTITLLAPENEDWVADPYLVEQVAARGPYPRPIHNIVHAAASNATANPPARELARRLLDAFELARQRAHKDETAEVEGGVRSSDSPHPARPVDQDRAAEPVADTRPPEAEARWLQAQVLDNGGRQCEHSLRASARHRLVVRIGTPEIEWITAPADAPFPEADLPDGEEEYELRVIFWEPNHVPQPLVSSIYLPRLNGISTTCEFQFRTQAEAHEFAGRIVVAYENRILQTMILQGTVVADSDDTPVNHRLMLTPETFVRANLAGLDERPRIDISLLTDTAIDGVAQLTQITDGRATFRSLENLDLPLQRLRRRLSRVAITPEVFPSDLNASATVELLRFLARQGRLLFDGIVETQIGGHPIRHARRIQLVSARESFLPLEFVYEGPSPTPDATLCPQAAESLEDGECTTCEHDPAIARNIICPLRFWCMSRIIERHAVQPLPESGLAGAEYALQADPIAGREALRAPNSAVSAASHHVRSDQLEGLLETLGQTTVEAAEYVENWDTWRSVIRRQSPPLLVLLPHTLEDEDYIPTLEIGRDEWLPEDQITTDFVRAAPCSRTSHHQPPIVLLLGCETAVPDIPFQAFAAQFRLNGAAIVLSTLTPVLGRHAVPVAQLLLEELQRTARRGGVFGEAMLAVRRRALAMGIPMVLSLVAYGDADWRLQPGTVQQYHVGHDTIGQITLT